MKKRAKSQGKQGRDRERDVTIIKALPYSKSIKQSCFIIRDALHLLHSLSQFYFPLMSLPKLLKENGNGR